MKDKAKPRPKPAKTTRRTHRKIKAGLRPTSADILWSIPVKREK